MSQFGASPIQIIMKRNRQPRYQAHAAMNQRIGGFDRLLGFYLDLVEDHDLAAQQDPQVYDRMLRDAHYNACLQIRMLATASLPMSFVPVDQSAEAAEYAENLSKILTGRNGLLHSTNFLSSVMQAIPNGLSVTELIYANDPINKWMYPAKAFPSHKDRYVFDLDGHLCLRSPNDVFFGEWLPERRFIPHVFSPMPGSFNSPEDEARIYYGFGLNQVIYPWFIWKQLTLNMDFRFLDRFGNPTLVGRFPRKNAAGRDKVMNLMEYLTNNGKMVWPSDDGYDIDLFEANGTGHQNFMALLEYLDKQMSQAVLGSTLLLDQGDVGSYALGKVHQQTTFGRIAEYDRRNLEDTLNATMVRWIMELNHWPMEKCPTLIFQQKETEDTFQVIESLKLLQEMGFEITAEMVSEKTGFRQPRPGETILTFDPLGAMGGEGGFKQLNGKDSPLGGTDLTGKEKKSPVEKAHESGKKYGRFREMVTDYAGTGSRVHVHSATVDAQGNGETDVQMGHRHAIRHWRVMREGGHGHELMLNMSNDAHRKAFVESLAEAA